MIPEYFLVEVVIRSAATDQPTGRKLVFEMEVDSDEVDSKASRKALLAATGWFNHVEPHEKIEERDLKKYRRPERPKTWANPIATSIKGVQICGVTTQEATTPR